MSRESQVEAWRLALSPTVAAQADALWGKSNAGGTAEDPRPNLLIQHLFDALAVGELLWDRYLAPGIRMRLDDATERRGRQFLSWLCGMHDVGKASPAFQGQKAELAARVHDAGLPCRSMALTDARAWRHDRAGGLATKDVLLATWPSGRVHVDWVWPLVAGHHGVVPSVGGLRPPRSARRRDLQGGSEWAAAREWLVRVVTTVAGYRDLPDVEPSVVPTRADQLLLSGLMIMADWIASDERHFCGISLLDQVSAAGARERADAAWQALGLRGGWGALSHPGSDVVARRFGFRPRAAQAVVVEAAGELPGPGLMIVEAPTGEGKTEAALAAAEVLAARFGADGVFVGMPTQATSDPMFARVAAWSEAIAPGMQVALLHGKRMFNERWERLLERSRRRERAPAELDEYGCPIEDLPVHSNVNEDAEPGEPQGEAAAEWFLGRKRGLLAPLVVGTVDQLLLAATHTRHVMLRYAGLAGKVVILDEVHAADVYMSQFLGQALAWLGQGRVPVVLLSATLAPGQRRDLIRRYLAGALSEPYLDVSDLPGPAGYPNVTSAWAEEGHAHFQVRASQPWRPSGRVVVEALEEGEEGPDLPVVALLSTELERGGCALVIRNTVPRAQASYEALIEAFPGEVTLLHGRFTAADRAERTEELVAQLGPAADGQRPHRKIVVATQIAEQSFDIDADLLVTDLAPVDLLIQRAGRLHRHDRPGAQRPSRLRTPRVVVTGFNLSGQTPWFPRGSRHVYGDYHLIASAAHVQAAAAAAGWMLPADVPDLVAAVYGGAPEVPSAWEAALADAFRAHEDEQRGRTAAAGHLLLATDADLPKTDLQGLHDNTSGSEEHVRVRDGESSTEIVLLRREDGRYHAIDGTPLGINAENARDHVRAVLGGTVRLPTHPALVTEVTAELGPLGEWVDHPLLRHTRVVVLDGDRSDILPSFVIRYDQRLGLRWEKKA